MQIKGKWTKHDNNVGLNDPAFPRKQYPFAFNKTDSIAVLLKQTYPNPTGLEAIYYTSIGDWPLYQGAPASYTLRSYYQSYYFNTNLKKILKADETLTAVRIYINNFGSVLQDQGEWLIDNQPTKVFVTLRSMGEWKGFPAFMKEEWGPGNIKDTLKTVLLTRNNKLPYTALTQKQYLLALKNFWNKKKQEVYDNSSGADKEYQKSVDAMRNNTQLTPEQKQKILTGLEQTHEKILQTRDESIRKLTAEYDKKIKLADDYLSTHSENEMQQPVVIERFGDFEGYFGTKSNKKVDYPVRIDPSYFKNNLPRYIPQFIVVEWNSEKDAPALQFRMQFENNFPLKKLHAMIDAQNKGEVVSDKIVVKGPDMLALRRRAERYADSILKIKPPIFTTPFVSTVPRDTSSGYKLPPRNDAMLGAVPKKTLTSAELKSHLQKIDTTFTSLLLSQGNKLPDVSKLNATSTSTASTLYLLDGSSVQAAWCAIKAVEKSPNDIVILNNAGGVLNACGFQPVAIPVLQTALDKSPGNSTVENNLGQSYMGLGDVTKASSYLQQVLTSSPYHPHANFSMACIEYAKGNNQTALNYVQKSLRGSFTDGAMHLLYKLKPDARLLNILKGHYKPTDYFNEDKYHLPPQCENVNDVEKLEAEYKAYREMVERVKKQFDEIKDEENELGIKSMMEKTKNYQKSGIRTAPFAELGAMMVYDINLRLSDEHDKLERAQTIYRKEIHDLYEQYNDAYSHAESCGEQLELGNKYMEAMSAVTVEYQKTWLPIFREYYNDYAFWGRVQTSDKHLQRAAYAAAASGYLAELLALAETHFLHLCDPIADLKKEEENYVFKEPDCGIDIGMEFGIGSFAIDCEKMEYHFGGLLVADVVHTYRNHCTTIAIGAGLDLKFGGEKLKAGPIQGGFGATGKMQYFLTFDGTRPSDQGFIWEGAIKYKQKLSTGLESTIDEIDEVETNSVKVSAKTVLSVHNGFTFSGTVYDQLDKILKVPPEKQVNKNIKIYKHQ
jgi:tetratricopeptide (TPR) repeat protein